MVFINNRIPVPEFWCDFRLNRNPGKFFNDIFSYNPCVISRSAGDDMDFFTILYHLIGNREFIQFNLIALYSGTDGSFYGWRLFKDLLHHKMFVTAFFGCRNIPVHTEGLTLLFFSQLIVNIHFIPCNAGYFFVFQDQYITGIFQDCRNIGCNIVLILAKSYNQWTVFSCRNKHVGIVNRQYSEGISPFQFVQSF